MKHASLLLFSLLLAAGGRAAMKTGVEFARPGAVSLTLDAWVPDGPGPFPTVVLVHGGGWTKGDKQTFITPLFPPLTKAGFAWFTINYRLAPQYHFPAPVEDVETAIEWVKAHAREYKVDVRRIALVGESAGGHLVGFVGARDGKKLGLAAVVPFYGPHDLAGIVQEAEKAGRPIVPIQQLLGFEKVDDAALRLLREASPISHVTRGLPPFLLIHGSADQTVDYQQSVRMCERLRAAGDSCELYTVEGAPHGVGAWEKNPAFQGYKVKLVEWLKAVMK